MAKDLEFLKLTDLIEKLQAIRDEDFRGQGLINIIFDCIYLAELCFGRQNPLVHNPFETEFLKIRSLGLEPATAKKAIIDKLIKMHKELILQDPSLNGIYIEDTIKKSRKLIEVITLPDDFYIILVEEINYLYNKKHPMRIPINL
jgi:hypothetical protein